MIFLYAMPDVYGKAIDREYICFGSGGGSAESLLL
jgi:hypothetical protein